MTIPRLMYMSQEKLNELKDTIVDNLSRYHGRGFLDLAKDNGWNITSELVGVNLDMLRTLDAVNAAADTDADNSIIVYNALVGMTPALAMEPRVWTRFTHVECIDYSRARWSLVGSEEDQRKQVLKHFFAVGRTGVRDDNSISRLWWNMHIATSADPTNSEACLRLLLKTADIRLAMVERPTVVARKPLIRGIFRAMLANQWITSSENSFRRFMVELNVDAGGLLFEIGSESEIDDVILNCAQKAQSYLKRVS